MATTPLCSSCGSARTAAIDKADAEVVCQDCGAMTQWTPAPEPALSQKPKLVPKAPQAKTVSAAPKIKNALSEKPGGALRKRMKRDLGSDMKKARGILMAGVLIFAMVAIGWYLWLGGILDRAVRDLDKYSTILPDPREVASRQKNIDLLTTIQETVALSQAGLSAFFLGLFFWSKHALEKACYVGLVGYIVAAVSGSLFLPLVFLNNLAIFFHVIMLVGLIAGIKSSISYRTILAREAQAAD